MDDQEHDIKKEMLEILFEKAKGRFSKKIIEFGTRPRCYGSVCNPDGRARVTSDCGDTIDMSLRLKDGKVVEARFTSEGCLTTIAAAQAAAEMAEGKTLRECLGINQTAVSSYLDGLPDDSIHCAYLAALALHRALRDFALHRRGVWRSGELKGQEKGGRK
jgi:nitrogen fixation NifU-like protein